MSTYLIRGIDGELWHKVKTKALEQRLSVRAVIEHLLREWVKERASLASTSGSSSASGTATTAGSGTSGAESSLPS